MDSAPNSMGFSLQTIGGSELEYDLWEGQFAIGHGSVSSSGRTASFLKIQFQTLIHQVVVVLLSFLVIDC